MPFADFDKKLKDLNRLKQILEVLIRNEMGYFVEILRLKKFLPLSRTMDAKKFIRTDTQPMRVVRIVEQLGGGFIKLGQLLSIRPDLVPLEYANAFTTLQDHVPAFPYTKVKQIVETELHGTLKELFMSFDPMPIAAASIGQVHLAKLKNGKRVAVKVQRPDIERIFRSDIDIMYLFVHLMQKYHDQNVVDPKEIVEEFEDYTLKELNYVNEAKNIDAFHVKLKDSTSAKVPKVYWDMTTEKVLTMEYLEGRKLSELIKSKKMLNRKLIARNIVDSILNQVFVNGVFHADPHPGNILVTPNYTIAWLDFGIVGYFDDELREKVTDLFIASIQGDTDALATSLLSLGALDEGVDMEIFKADLKKNMERFYSIPVKEIRLGDLFEEIISLSKKHGLKLPKNFVLLGKTIITTQGVAAELDPDFNLVLSAKPFVEKLVKQRNSPRQVFTRLIKSTRQFKQFISDVPKQTNELLLRVRQVEKMGEKIDTDLKTLSSEMDKSSNRVALGILITAFLISSSLILNFEQPDFMGFPVFSLAGYLIAFFLFFVLTVSIARERI
ncbi:AarF/ABC1/UbiB kinase family protein [Candidatus Woesearchaeota archaeon]|nr:AarF/ABC1/UbiB kinase family protein [Candidatus Woesearchaeota archaeon]